MFDPRRHTLQFVMEGQPCRACHPRDPRPDEKVEYQAVFVEAIWRDGTADRPAGFKWRTRRFPLDRVTRSRGSAGSNGHADSADGDPEAAGARGRHAHEDPLGSRGTRAGTRVPGEAGYVSTRPPDPTEVDEQLVVRTFDTLRNGWQDQARDLALDAFDSKVWPVLTADWKTDHCEALAALADILDKVHGLVTKGIAKVVTVVVQWVGVPDLAAAMLGEFVARAVAAHFLAPLKTMAQLLRVTGAAVCACNGRLGSCACAKALAKQVVREAVAAEWNRLLTDNLFTRIRPPQQAGNAAWIGLDATYEYLRARSHTTRPGTARDFPHRSSEQPRADQRTAPPGTDRPNHTEQPPGAARPGTQQSARAHGPGPQTEPTAAQRRPGAGRGGPPSTQGSRRDARRTAPGTNPSRRRAIHLIVRPPSSRTPRSPGKTPEPRPARSVRETAPSGALPAIRTSQWRARLERSARIAAKRAARGPDPQSQSKHGEPDKPGTPEVSPPGPSLGTLREARADVGQSYLATPDIRMPAFTPAIPPPSALPQRGHSGGPRGQ